LSEKQSMTDIKKELDSTLYRKLNESFRKRLICHIGVDCGFFVEMNYMVNAMLYCLDHRIRFQLYSEDANFGTGVGWEEFFLPFCEEVHEPFHKKYNFHRLPSWRRILKSCSKLKSVGPVVWKLKSYIKTITGRLIAYRIYKEYVLFEQDVRIDTNRQYIIPELGINASYYELYGLLAKMVWKFQPVILHSKEVYIKMLSLPLQYDGIHIRGGDKETETELIGGQQIMKMLNPKDNSTVFILTDDYRHIQNLQANYPYVQFLTLCQPEERGYHHKDFCKQSPENRKDAIVRLIISVDLQLKCHSFVGSITTGPSVFVMKLRVDDPLVQAVDCPKEDLASSLSLTIDTRAAISKKFSEIFS